MEPRKSARLRAKGRRCWNEDESDEGEKMTDTSTENLTPQDNANPAKRPRVEGLDEEAEEDDIDFVESESLGEDDADPSPKRSTKRAQSIQHGKSTTEQKNWDQLFEEDDDNHESETVQDYPLEVQVDEENEHFVIDGYIYRKLATERKCGLGGFYLRCYQDKDLNCGVRSLAMRTEEGKLMAKLLKGADQHSHDRPSEGSYLVSVPSKKHSSRPQRRRGQYPVGIRRRGRPPKVALDDDDNETDFGEDDSKRYKNRIEIFGMNKYYVMDGYVYRRHRERRVGYGGLYLRCYQDKDLNCQARAVAVWFKKQDDNASARERILFGRLSTTYPNHSHPKPAKGHFWVKPGQQTVQLPPHLRRSAAADSSYNAEYADFTEPASDSNFQASATTPKQSSLSRMLGPTGYTPAEPLKTTTPPRTSRRHETSSQKRRSQLHDTLDTPTDTQDRRVDKVPLIDEPEDHIRSKAPITMTVQVEDNGEHFIIDGFAFTRQIRGQPLLVCVESKGDSKCGARAALVAYDSSSKTSRSGVKAQFTNANARRHTHSRPAHGQYILPPKLIPSAPATARTSGSTKNAPALVSLSIFSRTPFLRPLSVPPLLTDEKKSQWTTEPRSVNLKSIISNYRYCLEALTRLQDGYYIGRFPQLGKLIDAPGGELIDYYANRTHARLPMIAGDERTAYLLNNDMKHYRAICDFMQMAQSDCERVVETYKRWLTPSRTRSWWNNGDMLEYICRILLRTDEYSEAYGAALSLCQRSTRLRHLFRPLLPFQEPKFLRCEKETIRRWEMRQSLEDVNARINSVRLREGDSDAAINRLLDDFESAASSFLKFYSKYGVGEPVTKDYDYEESSDISDEEWRLEAEIGNAERKKSSRARNVPRSKALERAPILSAVPRNDELSSDDEPAVDKASARSKAKGPAKRGRPKADISLRR